jgi:copper chaperone CopZ
VSYENGNAIIVFDQAQTGIEEIEEAIEKTGYLVADKKEIK